MAVKARDEITVAMLTDIANVARYYLVQPSTAPQPAAPTVNPAPAPWTTTEPDYVASSSLYTVDLTTFTDGTFDYSPVSKSSSYTAATQAKNAADAAAQAALGAQGTANSKTLTLTQSTYPTAAQQLSTTEWIDTAARTYAWTGAANSSTSTESADGTVVATNYATNPRATTSDGVNYDSTDYVSRYSWALSWITGITDNPDGFTTAARFTNPTTIKAAVGRGFDIIWNMDVPAPSGQASFANFPVAAGTTYYFGMWVRSSKAHDGIMLGVGLCDNAGSYLSKYVKVSQVSLIPGTWTFIGGSYVPPYTGYLVGYVRNGNAQDFVANETLDVTGMYMSNENRYFDGNSASTPANTRKHWDGTQWVPILDGTASQALTVANLAQAATQGLVSTGPAPASPAKGMVNFPTNASGNVVGMKYYDGTQWTSYAILSEDLMVVGEDGTIRLKNGVVSAPNLTADVLDVGNLTATGTATLAQAVAQAIWAGIVNAQAANIQDLHATDAEIDSAVIGKLAAQIITSKQFWTALTGARVGIDSTGIHAFNSAGVGTFELSGDTGNINGMNITGSNISGSSFSLQGLGTGSGSHTWIGDDFSSLTKTAPATSGGIGGGNSSDAYNYWRLDSFTSGSTLTASSAPLASARNGQGIRFTYSGTGWWSWVVYAGTTLPTVVPYTGTKTVSVRVRSSISTSGAYLYLGIKRSDGTAGSTSGNRLTLTPGVWTQITATVPQEYTLTDITLVLGTGKDAGTVDLDDFSVTSVTQGSSIVLDYDGNGNAEIVILDPAGNRVGVLNGVDNKLSGELVAGTAHLTGWKSDDGTNTRSGFVFDDAAGAVASDSAAIVKPRLISNKDAAGRVDTFLSTGVDASGKQALVQASQSMSKASMAASGPTGGAEILVNTSGQAFINGKCFTNGNALLAYLGSGNMQVGVETANSYWVISGGSVVIPRARELATIYFGRTYTAVASIVVTNGDTPSQHGYITLGGVTSTKFDVYTSGTDNNGPMRINYMVLGSIG